MVEYQMFMCALEAQYSSYKEPTIDLLKRDLLYYKDKIKKYVITHEIATDGTHEETKGSHFHFMVQMTKEDYHNFCKRVFIDKYKLRGRAIKGKPRQYGKTKDIRNVDKALSYTVKQIDLGKDTIRTNMDKEEIEFAFANSFKPSKKKNEYDELMKHLGKLNLTNSYDIKIEIISYYRIKNLKKRLTRTTLTGLCSDYMMYHTKTFSAEEIYNFLF